MYQIQKTKPFADTLTLQDDDKTLTIAYSVPITPTFSKNARALQMKIIDLQHNTSDEQDYDALGNAIVSLFVLVFGDENTKRIVAFYENDFATMLIDVFPYLRNTVFAELNRRTAARMKALKKQYR